MSRLEQPRLWKSNHSEESLVVDQEEVANAIVSAIHANADTKTRARTLRELEISLPRRQDGQTYVQFMNKFERTCQSLREESTARTHTLQFLAGCIRQAAPHLPPIKAPISGDNSLCNDVSISSKTRTYWQCRAETANAIVDGLLVAWGTTALSLYHVLAGLYTPPRNAEALIDLVQLKAPGFVDCAARPRSGDGKSWLWSWPGCGTTRQNRIKRRTMASIPNLRWPKFSAYRERLVPTLYFYR